MADLPAWVQILLIVASTLGAGFIGYGFAIRASRKERHHEIRVREYSLLLRSVDRLSRAMRALYIANTYDAKTDKQPLETFVTICGVAALILSPDSYREIMAKFEQAAAKGKFRSENEAFTKVNAKLVDEMDTVAALMLIEHGNIIQDAALTLELIGSRASTGPESRALLESLNGLALTTLAHSEDKAQKSAARHHLSEFANAIDMFSAAVKLEIKETL